MRKLILLTILLVAALVWTPLAFAAGTLMVTVDNVTVHDEPELSSDVMFQLYRAMEITPEERQDQDGLTWVRFDIRGRKFWVVEKEGSSGVPLLSDKVKIDLCGGCDKKVVIDKKLRTLTVFVRKASGWEALRTFTVGLGKGAGQRAETRRITRSFAYLILKGNGKFALIENTDDNIDNALSKASGGKAVIALDRKTKTLALYSLNNGKWEGGEPKMYSYGETVIAGDYVVKFSKDKFNIIINKFLYPKTKMGDRKTPEGVYFIAEINPVSRFGLDPKTSAALPSLHLSYPNSFDAWDGLRYGIISLKDYNRITSAIARMKMPPQDTPMGNLIMIHGGGNDDWTAGCIALEDEDMKGLLDEVERYTCVEIK
ncbi:MAG: L,D-transpeptidase family protein [Nitrospirae bacterium]|nr:L,D-transpeptidase family protein [Nitrospirota bacterium]